MMLTAINLVPDSFGLSSALVHAAAAAPRLGQGTGIDVSVWRVVGSLLFCLALAAGAIFALRRKLPAGKLFNRADTGRLKLVDQISLGPQRSVYLLELDGKEYLALFAPQAASLTAVNGRRRSPVKQSE